MGTAGGGTNKVRETRRQLRQRKLEPPLPPGWSKNVHIKHMTAEIDDAITVLRNRLVAAPLSIRLFAKSGTATGQGAASDIRGFLDKAWLDMNSGSPSAHFLGTDSQVADGCWAAHLTWDQDWIDAALEAEDTDEFLRASGLPFVLETPDLLNVYPEFDRKKEPTTVVSIETLFVRDLLNKEHSESDGTRYWLEYNAPNKQLLRSQEPRTYDNLWDAGYAERVELAVVEDCEYVHHVLLNGVDKEEKNWGLGKWPNLFKRVSWVFIPGDFSNSTDLLQRWKPLVLNMYAIAQDVNMIRSARINLGMMMGLPRIGFEKDPDKSFGPVGDEVQPELTFNEDGTFSVTPGWHLSKFEPPVDAANSLDKAEASIEMERARYRPPAP